MPFEIPTIDIYYVNVFVLIQFSLKTSVLSQLLSNLHKIIGRRCVLESWVTFVRRWLRDVNLMTRMGVRKT